MGPYFTILFDDLAIMVKSWLVWIWLLVTAVAGVAAVLVGAAFTDPASFILSWGLTLYLALGSFVVIVIAANATPPEQAYVGDAIISRGLTPAQYVLAKMTSRLFTVISLFLAVTIPASLAMLYMLGETNDLSGIGITFGLMHIAFALAVLVILTMMFSSFFGNSMVSSVAALLGWYSLMGLYALSQARDFSPEGVLGQLPPLLRGSLVVSQNILILAGTCGVIILLGALTVYFFQRRDL